MSICRTSESASVLSYIPGEEQQQDESVHVRIEFHEGGKWKVMTLFVAPSFSSARVLHKVCRSVADRCHRRHSDLDYAGNGVDYAGMAAEFDRGGTYYQFTAVGSELVAGCTQERLLHTVLLRWLLAQRTGDEKPVLRLVPVPGGPATVTAVAAAVAIATSAAVVPAPAPAPEPAPEAGRPAALELPPPAPAPPAAAPLLLLARQRGQSSPSPTTDFADRTTAPPRVRSGTSSPGSPGSPMRRRWQAPEVKVRRKGSGFSLLAESRRGSQPPQDPLDGTVHSAAAGSAPRAGSPSEPGAAPIPTPVVESQPMPMPTPVQMPTPAVESQPAPQGGPPTPVMESQPEAVVSVGGSGATPHASEPEAAVDPRRASSDLRKMLTELAPQLSAETLAAVPMVHTSVSGIDGGQSLMYSAAAAGMAILASEMARDCVWSATAANAGYVTELLAALRQCQERLRTTERLLSEAPVKARVPERRCAETQINPGELPLAVGLRERRVAALVEPSALMAELSVFRARRRVTDPSLQEHADMLNEAAALRPSQPPGQPPAQPPLQPSVAGALAAHDPELASLARALERERVQQHDQLCSLRREAEHLRQGWRAEADKVGRLVALADRVRKRAGADESRPDAEQLCRIVHRRVRSELRSVDEEAAELQAHARWCLRQLCALSDDGRGAAGAVEELWQREGVWAERVRSLEEENEVLAQRAVLAENRAGGDGEVRRLADRVAQLEDELARERDSRMAHAAHGSMLLAAPTVSQPDLAALQRRHVGASPFAMPSGELARAVAG